MITDPSKYKSMVCDKSIQTDYVLVLDSCNKRKAPPETEFKTTKKPFNTTFHKANTSTTSIDHPFDTQHHNEVKVLQQLSSNGKRKSSEDEEPEETTRSRKKINANSSLSQQPFTLSPLNNTPNTSATFIYNENNKGPINTKDTMILDFEKREPMLLPNVGIYDLLTFEEKAAVANSRFQCKLAWLAHGADLSSSQTSTLGPEDAFWN